MSTDVCVVLRPPMTSVLRSLVCVKMVSVFRWLTAHLIVNVCQATSLPVNQTIVQVTYWRIVYCRCVVNY